ncbi:Asp-tRNA(Asn)/Glu-tRNA(Gln) amidotransferase subunit GatC [Patescibacteria group bacterium]|nr:Asp-tRNA(Asn)/Glu-tRNA(Gln) amidotransferase subunit GatC [Patescibacteria group bacterium]MBU1673620.1 Asp-tRNA(Asn)/Glu-tRNA(Gln) amidotransferase subunit GatC [Patescibacteria group bacterium]MBU1963892.1 Asp-tRNA(Asn)/Glu-tRNA(Gln) amidotransferase subunit GatC [Patescibacteria group bacterium]
MKISPEEVKKIGKLAKITLSEDEVKKMSKDLTAVLDYVEKLDEVKTDKVEPTSQVTGLLNIRRKDKVDYDFEQSDMLDSAPEAEGNLIKVKKIFDD